jgi:hypothetical protein
VRQTIQEITRGPKVKIWSIAGRVISSGVDDSADGTTYARSGRRRVFRRSRLILLRSPRPGTTPPTPTPLPQRPRRRPRARSSSAH